MLFFLALISLPTFSYLIVQQPKVQQYLVQKLTDKLSGFLGTPVSMSKADIDLFNNITFHNFCVLSPKKDTILYTPELTFHFNAFTLSSHYIDIMNVTLTRPRIHFYIDSVGCINFQFIINKFLPKNKVKVNNPLMLCIHDITIKQADFTLKSHYHVQNEYGVNFSDIHLDPLNVKVTGFSVNSGLIDMNIRKLECNEKSGFILRDFSSQLKINKQFMVFNHLMVKTDKSDIKAKKVHFKFNDFKEFNTGIFGKKVKMDIDLRPSEISTDDLGYFLTSVKDLQLKVKLSGKVNGVLNDLKGKDIELYYRNGTVVKANVNIHGLPKLKSAFIYADIKNLTTTPEDIQHIHVPGTEKRNIILPKLFRSIEYLKYQGQFTGLINDFTTNGEIKTNMGNLESDFTYKPDSLSYCKFDVRLNTTAFDLGSFLNNKYLLGNVSLNVAVNGQISCDKCLNTQLNGTINTIYWNGYNYQNIKLDGTLSNNNYKGSIVVADPNLNADFYGRINLSEPIATYNLKANVKKANLYKLNFDKSDTSSFISVLATANLEGNSIDNIQGDIKILNTTFKKMNKEIHVNDFLLYNKYENDSNHIYVRSELADAEIRGIYHYKDLVNSAKMFVKQYLPSLITDSRDTDVLENNFSFKIELKNTHQLTDYFIPGFYISKDTKLNGTYNSSKNELDFLITIPLLQHYSRKWYNASISGTSIGKIFSLISGCNSLKIDNINKLDNLTIITDIKNDSIESQMNWNNWDTIVYKGNLSFLAYFNELGKNGKPITRIQLKPSEIVMRDSSWNISSGIISIDSSDISIDNFALVHQNQLVKAFGDISRNSEKILNVEFKNINLGNLTTLLNVQKWKPEGILNGKAEISNIYGNFLLHSTLKIDSLSINSQKFGTAYVKTVLDNSDKNINIEANTQRGDNTSLSIKGLYAINTKKIDFDIDVHQLKISLFEPFVANVFSDIQGNTKGKVTLTGSLQTPVLNGSLRMDDVSFVVNYLKTRYHFNGDVNLDKNKFIIKNIEVFDRFKNNAPAEHMAIVNGKIDVGQFKDIFIDLNIDARNFECLKTSEKDNPTFSGQGFGTGKLSIKGLTRNLEITSLTSIVSDKGTKINIPLESKSDLTESNFIQMVSKHKTEKPFDQYEIDTDSADNKVNYVFGGVKVNLDFTLTPDAQVQLIYDAKIGDLIRGKGNGDLNLRYENGIFNMYGIYTIEGGDYLYTLGNLINKKFIIEQGGTITWDGNPLDAIINLEAFYQVSASLQDLGPQNPLWSQSGRIKVNCQVALTDKLMNPNIKCDIILPNADQNTIDQVNATISSDEEKYKQFAALMIAGSFMPSSNVPTQNTSTSAAGSTSMEFVSNQLSNWFSQISHTFNINLNYRPTDDFTTQSAQVGINTQIGSKVSFTGNMDMGGDPRIVSTTATNNSNILPDVELDYKLTKNGKLQFKTFTRPNQSIDAVAPTMQGIGIIYKEDFNSFFDLIKHYYSMIFNRKEDKIKPVTEKSKTDGDHTDENDTVQNK